MHLHLGITNCYEMSKPSSRLLSAHVLLFPVKLTFYTSLLDELPSPPFFSTN